MPEQSATAAAAARWQTRPIFQLLVLALAAAAGAYARTTLSPIQEALAASLALSDNQAALLQGPALAIPFLLFALPLGLLIDRGSRVRLLMGLISLSIAGSVLTALAPDFAWLFAARCLIGLAAIAINPVALSLIADMFVPAERGRATMAIAVGGYGGMASAFALGGALLAMRPEDADAWRWSMLGLTAPLSLILLLTLVLREPPRAALRAATRHQKGIVAKLWDYRSVILPLLAGLLLIEIAIGAVLVWTAPALARHFALASGRIGTVMAAAVLVSGIAGPIAGGLLADLCERTGGSRKTLRWLIGLALLSAGAGLFPLNRDVVLATAGLIFFVTLIGAAIVMATTLFTLIIPDEIRGLCMSIMMAASVVFGLGIAPLSVSFVSGYLGGGAMLGTALAAVSITTCLMAAALFALGVAHLPRAGAAR